MDIVAEKWVRDVETIKVVAHERRLAILDLMQEPTTVKMVSAELNIPASKLYYHVNLLLQHELIQVVEHNIDSGIVEKIYQVTARQLKIINPLLSPEMPPEAATTLIETMLNNAVQGFRSAYVQPHDMATPPRHPFLSTKRFRLTDAQLTGLHGNLDALMQEMQAIGEENVDSAEKQYDLTIIFNQAS